MHCGFKDNGGIHPPHCVQKSIGASFDDRIKRLLACELLNNETDLSNTEVVFKAMEMESFGASIATNKNGKWYNTHNSCMKECDNPSVPSNLRKKVQSIFSKRAKVIDNMACLNLTGGFKIDSRRPKLENIGDFIQTKDLTQKYDIACYRGN